MELATLPTNNAQEPQEDAQTHVNIDGPKKKRNITFDKSYVEGNSSQNKYKEVLSQPASELTHREKLLWLQKRRSIGLWVQCDECDRWRYLPQVLDRHQLPYRWYCRMNPDTSFAMCSVPEEDLHVRDEEDLIHSQYSAGSIVWARVDGWPWWPAMVDDCPDTEQFYWLDGFSDIPTHYHVVFFDENDVTRAWVAPNNMSPYFANKSKMIKELTEKKKFKLRIISASKQADEAEKMSLSDRLIKFSFIARYKGHISAPKKISKHTMEQHNKKFLKKFKVNIDLNLESNNEDDGIAKTQKDSNDTMVIESDSDKTTNTNVVKAMESDTAIVDTLVPNSDSTQIDSVTLKTPNTLAETDNTGNLNSDVIPMFETQESFKIPIPSPSSDDFDF